MAELAQGGMKKFLCGVVKGSLDGIVLEYSSDILKVCSTLISRKCFAEQQEYEWKTWLQHLIVAGSFPRIIQQFRKSTATLRQCR